MSEGNYGRATRDAAAALRVNSRNTKAYYRAGLALLALDKLGPALQALSIGSGTITATAGPSVTRKQFAELSARVRDRQRMLEQQERKRREREEQKRLEVKTLKRALDARGVMQTRTGETPDLEDAAIILTNPADAESELRLPVLVLYPTAGQSEMVKGIGEDETVGDLLGTVLPVPWEGGMKFGGAEGEAVECYVESAMGTLRKAGKRVAWKKLLRDGGTEVRDGLVRIFVVPKERVEEWISEWKRMKGKE